MSMPAAAAPSAEAYRRFACFGTTIAVGAGGGDRLAVACALAGARAIAEDVHRRLTRFEADSELCRLNADPRAAVPASELMRSFAALVRWAGEASGGLVDATCLDAVEAAGYREHFDPARRGAERASLAVAAPGRTESGLADAGDLAWAGSPRSPLPGDWRSVGVRNGTVVRPPGVRLDSGGLGKGLAADRMAGALRGCPSWVVDCAGDLRLGGTAGRARAVEVRDPFDDERVLHRFHLAAGAVATSGVTRRRWAGGHHLIDPRTGAPADTGVVQATALAARGAVAEVRAKAALLAGPRQAAVHLPDGGLFVTADGRSHLVAR
ncbi:MAG: FAD:protein FMN transferase [Solirubrobacteraceae bacterium]